MDARDTPETRIRIVHGDRLLVVANPATRRDVRKVIASLRAAAPAGVQIDVCITTRPGEARELAERHAPGARMVIAIGGDGTVAEVASAAIRHVIPLGILPGGSTNIIAREMRVPTDSEAGAALLLGPHRVKSIDVGWSDRKIFLHMAGAGFDSRMFARSNSELKRKIGWLAYLPAAIRALFDRSSEVRVIVDGQETHAMSPLVLVANGRSVMHTAMRLALDISKSDGMLDIFLVTANTPIAKAKVIRSFAMRRLDRSPYVIRLRGRHVEITAEPPLPVQFDGDVDGTTPLALDVDQGALKVIVPEIPEDYHHRR